MEDLYRLDLPAATTISCSDDMTSRIGNFSLGNYTTTAEIFYSPPCINNSMLQFDTAGSDMSDFGRMKSQIANHPRYPNLLSAYIECQKIGVPPEMASLLEEIRRENNSTRSNSEIGADPELDEFMESYCKVLLRYKEELSKPFEEATTFFGNMESQLSNLCKGELLITRTLDYRSGGTSEEELSHGGGGETEVPEYQESYGPGAPGPGDEQDIKGMLMRKYSGYLSSLKKEFLKKRKKGKLPKDARTTLMDWWNSHYRWPYPTEEEKLKLSEVTGLDQKQINNWFINQRKRHWKPSEDMKFALLEGVRLGDNNNINGESIFFNTTATSD